MDLLSILDYVEMHQISALLISFDFAKAFDNVCWEFLDYTLKFFNFGNNFRIMIQNALRGMKACTINYGFTGEYFNIEKGLRQGSPISTGLFILVIEMLGLKIRQESKIAGITVEGKTKKHAQYADDLWTIIAATQSALDAVMDIFKKYASVSCLEINFEKTQIVRLGPLKDKLDFSLKSEKALQWTDATKILGITVIANRKRMMEENYKELYVKMSKVLNPWKARSTSLIGKVLLINTLLMSQSVYKFLCLTDPPNDFFKKVKQLVVNFLWDGKKAKIAYNTLINSTEQGGLKLVDIETKYRALKMIWVKKSVDTKNFWKIIANDMLPYKIPELFEANLSEQDVLKLDPRLSSNMAIISILRTWAISNYRIPVTKEQVLGQRRNGSPYVSQKLESAGVKSIRDIYDQVNDRFFTYAELKYEFGNIGNFLEYHALIKNIPDQYKNILKCKKVNAVTKKQQKSRIDSEVDLFGMVLNSEKVATKMYWAFIESRIVYDHGRIAWQNDLQIIIDPDIWRNIRKHAFTISLSTRLREFQYKLLSKKLITNIVVSKWCDNVKPNCSFCDFGHETVMHLLCECKVTKSFWKTLERWLKYGCEINIKFSPSEIILNKTHYKQKSQLIDTIILTAKQYIYACKCLKEKPKLLPYLSKLHRIYITENAIARYDSKKNKKHEQKWKQYIMFMT